MPELRPIDLSKPGISFVTAIPYSTYEGLAIISIDQLFEKREDHSFLAVLDNNGARGTLVPVNCVDAVAYGQNDGFHGYFFGENGEVWNFDGNTIEQRQSVVSDELVAPRSTCQMNGDLYMVGGGNFLFKHDAGHRWSSKQIVDDEWEDRFHYVVFEKIIAGKSGRLYGCGWHGLAWTIENDSFSLEDIPTNVDLNAIAEASDRSVYLGGNEGVLFHRDTEQSWMVVENEVTAEPLWSIAEYEGRIFVAIVDFLYEIVDGVLVDVEYSHACLPPSYVNRLESVDSCLWSIGAKQICVFKNGRWSQLYLLG